MVEMMILEMVIKEAYQWAIKRGGGGGGNVQG